LGTEVSTLYFSPAALRERKRRSSSSTTLSLERVVASRARISSTCSSSYIDWLGVASDHPNTHLNDLIIQHSAALLELRQRGGLLGRLALRVLQAACLGVHRVQAVEQTARLATNGGDALEVLGGWTLQLQTRKFDLQC